MLKLRTVVFILSTILSQSIFAFTYTQEITEAEIQQKVAAMMPLERKKSFLTVILSKPKIVLSDGTDHISFYSKVKLKALGGLTGTGSTKIKGSIEYNAKKGEFYLRNPKIVDLKMKDVPSSLMPKIKSIAQSFLSQSLKKRPIYRFKDNDLKQKLAKSVLKSVTIKDKKLQVVLSAF